MPTKRGWRAFARAVGDPRRADRPNADIGSVREPLRLEYMLPKETVFAILLRVDRFTLLCLMRGAVVLRV